MPTINVSLVDLTFTAERATTKDEINALMTAAANGPLKGIMDVNNEPLVSSDFNHTTVSSTFDATQTRVLKAEDGSTLVKVLAWYDNEWGYSCRMLDAARAWMNAKHHLARGRPQACPFLSGAGFDATPAAPLRLAINGYGRIGRCFLRALHESPCRDRLQVVAINEPAALESIVHLTRFDSTHGRFPGTVEVQGATPADRRRAHRRQPRNHARGRRLARAGIDLVVECSGHYSDRAGLQRFIDAGCPRLLLASGEQCRRRRRDDRSRHQPRDADRRRAHRLQRPGAQPMPSCLCSICWRARSASSTCC